jgi:hypothetical protein
MKPLLCFVASGLVILAFAILARSPHEKLVVLFLEGAELDLVRNVSAENETPFFTAIASSSLVGELVASGDVRSLDSVVAAIVGSASDSATQTGTSSTPLWSALAHGARASIIVGISGADRAEAGGSAIVLPGPEPSGGFLGSNLGLTTNLDRLSRGDVPWPYSVDPAKLLAARAEISVGEVTPWIEMSVPVANSRDSRRGLVRVYALDEDTVYLTPMYTRYRAGTAATPEPYVADDPSLVVLSSRVGEYLPRHVSDLAQTRVALATELAAERRWDLLVYVDRRIATSAKIERGGSGGPTAQDFIATSADSSTSLTRTAYLDVGRSMSGLLEVAGPSAVVLVVGVHNAPTRGDVVGWYAVVSSSATAAESPATIDELGATLEYLLALPRVRTSSPISSIAAAYPQRRLVDSRAPLSSASESVPLSAATLRELSGQSPNDRGAVTATNENR